MSLTFPLAKPSDLTIIIGLMRELYEQDHLVFDERMAQKAVTRFLLDHSLGRLWLIALKGKPIGYMALTFGYSLEYHGRDAFLDEIYIQQAYRGKGLGTKAISFVEEECRSLGVHVLHLEVERENKTAQTFYHKMGFKDHDRYLLTKWMS